MIRCLNRAWGYNLVLKQEFGNERKIAVFDQLNNPDHCPLATANFPSRPTDLLLFLLLPAIID
jgi:hypothetical protein